MDITAKMILKIYDLPGFKIYYDNGFFIEAEGIRYNGTYLSIEEAILEATIYILSRIEAKKYLLKEAKIVLE